MSSASPSGRSVTGLYVRAGLRNQAKEAEGLSCEGAFHMPFVHKHLGKARPWFHHAAGAVYLCSINALGELTESLVLHFVKEILHDCNYTSPGNSPNHARVP